MNENILRIFSSSKTSSSSLINSCSKRRRKQRRRDFSPIQNVIFSLILSLTYFITISSCAPNDRTGNVVDLLLVSKCDLSPELSLFFLFFSHVSFILFLSLLPFFLSHSFILFFSLIHSYFFSQIQVWSQVIQVWSQDHPQRHSFGLFHQPVEQVDRWIHPNVEDSPSFDPVASLEVKMLTKVNSLGRLVNNISFFFFLSLFHVSFSCLSLWVEKFSLQIWQHKFPSLDLCLHVKHYGSHSERVSEREKVRERKKSQFQLCVIHFLPFRKRFWRKIPSWTGENFNSLPLISFFPFPSLSFRKSEVGRSHKMKGR